MGILGVTVAGSHRATNQAKRKARVVARHRQESSRTPQVAVWLGASAISVGVGAGLLAGAGQAVADSGPAGSTSSSRSADSADSSDSNKSAKPARVANKGPKSDDSTESKKVSKGKTSEESATATAPTKKPAFTRKKAKAPSDESAAPTAATSNAQTFRWRSTTVSQSEPTTPAGGQSGTKLGRPSVPLVAGAVSADPTVVPSTITPVGQVAPAVPEGESTAAPDDSHDTTLDNPTTPALLAGTRRLERDQEQSMAASATATPSTLAANAAVTYPEPPAPGTVGITEQSFWDQAYTQTGAYASSGYSTLTYPYQNDESASVKYYDIKLTTNPAAIFGPTGQAYLVTVIDYGYSAGKYVTAYQPIAYNETIKISTTTYTSSIYGFNGTGFCSSASTCTVSEGPSTLIAILAKPINISLIPTPKPDTTPPTAPSIASKNVTDKSADLVPTGGTDNLGIAGYNIYRDGTKIASGVAVNTAYTDSGLDFDVTYHYTARAVDAAGNESPDSAAVSVTTLTPAEVPGFWERLASNIRDKFIPNVDGSNSPLEVWFESVTNVLGIIPGANFAAAGISASVNTVQLLFAYISGDDAQIADEWKDLRGDVQTLVFKKSFEMLKAISLARQASKVPD